MKSSVFTLFYVITISNATLAQKNFTLKSTDLSGSFTKVNEFKGFGCDGENASPQFSWHTVPAGTKSFAITCYDPDAPTGAGWWHWVVFDIPATTTELLAKAGNPALNLMPKGHGLHAYIFTVYALKTEKLGLDAHANPELVAIICGKIQSVKQA